MKKTATQETVNEEINLSETEISKEESQIKKSIKITKVYIGPTIEHIVTKNTVFNNGLPKFLSDEMERQPLINNLIIPIDQLAAARTELRNQGSTLSILYGKIKTKQED
ncbi:hypothetical protein [Lachnotalea glycerini]|uniref:Uncharacterized protein n=1 Tax=Lachnotalea glycerini TaxID=1763509 RepID=A0A371J7D8_9FIRM|nr:hypothetical protein [Lachnotalea glycerini]RDY28654.1 hypothetical protein CG710_019290 [Lachnotalea glycerini]